ncbi:hypothetical protein HET69_12925 [Streptomyces sp. CJ_13]|uniref:hypothetical protein n=1 Tax=Streptomyces sp. CJ_13 TaxID=2724943 RepID=UPI001BDD2E8F|nr:hypothetical protein [Streptomyces sp. CJ_13]MBT1184905.1 hypothetical protein [Streptomyces sp. CJ_13]
MAQAQGQGQGEEYGPGSPDYGLSYEPDPSAGPADDYGLGSPDYGLSYESDPWADPMPDENTGYGLHDRSFDADDAESMWEAAFRDGRITREQFQSRRWRGTASEQAEAPDAGPVIRSAVENVRAKLADPGLSCEQRAINEEVLASLQRTLDEKQAGPDESDGSPMKQGGT